MMSLHHIHNSTSFVKQKKSVKKAYEKLEKVFKPNFKGPVSLQVGNDVVELPVLIINKLVDILNEISDTKTLSQDETLTTQQAATILNVSRPFVVKLIEAEELPSFKVGKHRRIYKSDLLKYKEKSLKTRRRILQKLVDEAQDLDMGY